MKTLILTLTVTLFSINAFSAVRTWDGGGADANWQTAANWVGDIAPSANDDLVFPAAATQFATNNDYFFLTNFSSITIDGSYTIGGNPMRLGVGGLTVTSGTQAINTAVTLNGTQTFTGGTGSTTTIALLSFGSSGLTLSGAGSFGLGLISGSGSLNKVGTGATLIAAASGYSGSIFVGNGILVVDASIPNSSVIVEAPSGGVGGTGTVGAVSVMNGAVSAGTLTAPTGVFNTGNLSLSSNGNYLCKIGGTLPGAGGHDQLNVTGTVNVGGSRLAPLPWNAFRPAIGDSFTILRNDGTDPIIGTFLNAAEGSVFAGPLNTAFRITYRGGDGNDIVVTRVARAGFDFDGDGRSDVSIFRPSDATWNIVPSGGGPTTTQHWGTAGDELAPADFDGDNRTDLAIFRPSDGLWYILNSLTSTATIVPFGLNGDLPRPNDFDGDGRADITVFRPSSGIWYELRSLGNQYFAQAFGTSGDIPLIADFDGDGLGDLCVYRPSEGSWHFLQSGTNSYLAFPFGIATDVPAPADYDGDGRTDVAVFRATSDPNQPDFYILLSGPQTYLGPSWGVPGDVPVVADYDGDGRADVAVFRPSSNTWYLLRSTAGFAAVDFGAAGDRPIPAAYTP